jgi:hypothetical protein
VVGNIYGLVLLESNGSAYCTEVGSTCGLVQLCISVSWDVTVSIYGLAKLEVPVGWSTVVISTCGLMQL